jgi:hypothetical protein
MNYTLAVAAKAVGINTILRVIKGGRITGSHDELDQCRVEPVEVHQAPSVEPVEVQQVLPVVTEQRCEPDAAQLDAATDDAAWRAEVAARVAVAEARLGDLKAMLDDMRTERDAWRKQAQRLALPNPEPARKSWRWLRSTG